MSNNRKVYSFKAVGQLATSVAEQAQLTVVKDPIGILTPVSFAQFGGTLFSMSFDVKQQIRDNLKNLILTNTGERLMMTDLGADLRRLATEVSNEDVVNAAINSISSTVSKYMPFVELENFETRTEPSLNGSNIGIVVRVSYSVPSINATNQAVEAVIYAVG
jgi:phage baseplate assembly protein W